MRKYFFNIISLSIFCLINRIDNSINIIEHVDQEIAENNIKKQTYVFVSTIFSEDLFKKFFPNNQDSIKRYTSPNINNENFIHFEYLDTTQNEIIKEFKKIETSIKATKNEFKTGNLKVHDFIRNNILVYRLNFFITHFKYDKICTIEDFFCILCLYKCLKYIHNKENMKENEEFLKVLMSNNFDIFSLKRFYAVKIVSLFSFILYNDKVFSKKDEEDFDFHLEFENTKDILLEISNIDYDRISTFEKINNFADVFSTYFILELKEILRIYRQENKFFLLRWLCHK